MSVNFVKKTVKLTKDPSGQPATDLSAIGDDEIRKMAEKIQLALNMLGWSGLRAEVRLDVDHSGSMLEDYKSGKLLKLVKWAVAFALVVDKNGKVPLRAWDHRLFPDIEVTWENVDEAVNSLWDGDPRSLGSTVMSAPIRSAIDEARAGEDLLIQIIAGDGDPDWGDRKLTFDTAMESASVPLWIKMLTLRPVPFMKDIDDAKSRKDAKFGIGAKRLIDNFDTQDVDLENMTGLAFAKLMVEELDTYLADAQTEGVLV